MRDPSPMRPLSQSLRVMLRPSRLRWSSAALVVASFLSAEACSVSFQRACDDDEDCRGPMGGERPSGSTGGRSGAPEGGEGGLGGEEGEGGAGVGGEGIGGEKTVDGSGGNSSVVPSPILKEAIVGGEKFANGDTILGLEDRPELVFRFSEPMDKKSVQNAYSSKQRELSREHVAFSWNKGADELRVTPLTPIEHEEVTEPDAETLLFTISLEKGAKSRAGGAIEETFQASFRLKKRVTYFVIPDMRHSLWTTTADVSAEPMISEDGLYPDHQWFFCPIVVNDARPKEAGSLLLGYELVKTYVAYQSYVSFDWDDPEHRSKGVYAFPLPANIDSIESASLGVVKWLGTVSGVEAVLDRADFSVDVLATDDEGIQSWFEEPLIADLTNTDGDDTSFGYGPFEFEMTDVVRESAGRGDKWSAYRLGFEDILEADEAVYACAAASLTIVYWAE